MRASPGQRGSGGSRPYPARSRGYFERSAGDIPRHIQGRPSRVLRGTCDAAGVNTHPWPPPNSTLPGPVGFLQRSRFLFLRPQWGTNFLVRCNGFTTASGGCRMKSLVVKRSIVVSGHKTSVSLEDAFWNALKEIAKARNVTLSELVAAIDGERQHENLSSTIRLFVLGVYRKQLTDLKEGRISESIFWAAA